MKKLILIVVALAILPTFQSSRRYARALPSLTRP